MIFYNYIVLIIRTYIKGLGLKTTWVKRRDKP
jgi:hypothetical protein